MKTTANNPKGFTLVELLMAMGASLVVLLAIYTAYQNHQRSHVTQQLVVDMQQNARVAMSLMKREIRMMGYDPAATDGIDNHNPDDGNLDCPDPMDIDADANAHCNDAAESAHNNPFPIGIVTAEESRIRFTADLSYDDVTTDREDYAPDLNGANEVIEYKLSGTTLQRQDGAGGFKDVAYDIEAVGFAYAFDEDSNGVLDTFDPDDPDSAIIWAVDSNLGDDKLDNHLDVNMDGVIEEADGEGGVPMGTQVDINRIKAVRIWLLARTRQPIKDHTDNNIYVVGPIFKGPGYGDWDPGRKYVLLTTTIYCRNMGS